MLPMTGFEFGDVVLVPSPFSDQTTHKTRPAVVVSSASYHRECSDRLLLAITSQIRSGLGFGEALVSEWKQAAGVVTPGSSGNDGAV